MKILIFSLAYDPMIGGAEVAIKEITNRIDDIEFDMVTLRFNRAHPKVEKIGNVNVYRIGGGMGYLSKILFVPQAALFALRREYDAYWLMMTYMLFPVVVGRVMGDRTPYILTLQDGDPFTHVFNRLRILFFKPLLSYGFKHAAKVQVLSHFLATWAKQMGYKGHVEVIGNGVEVEKFENHAPKEKGQETILITVSRLVKKNGVGDIITALKFLPEHVRLQVIGGGELGLSLREQVRELGLESRVEFLGSMPNHEIIKYLHKADIFIRPSLSEGFGISFIEAMAAGLPVIATPVGGIPDFLKDGGTGLFCQPEDPVGIARTVQRLINDESLRERIQSTALKMVKEKYDWSLLATEMKERVFKPFSLSHA